MKRIVLVLLILSASLFAELKNVLVTPEFLNKKIKIIDIRTTGEWINTGIVKGAYTLMFFDERGKYNIEKFLKDLNGIVKKGEQFALICRTGSRTRDISKYLSTEFNYNVINLDGGMMKLMREGYKPVKYVK